MLSTPGGAMSVVALPAPSLSTGLDTGYRCSVCSRVFRRQAACRRHEHDAHSDADESGRHHCAVCGKTFASRATLVSHRATHDDAAGNLRRRAAALDGPNVDDESSLGGTTAVEDCCVDDEICLDEDGAEMHVAVHSPLEVIAIDNNNDQKQVVERFEPAEVVEDSTSKKPTDLRLTTVSVASVVTQRNNVLLCRTAAAADVPSGSGSPSTAVDLSRKRRLSGCNGGTRVEMIKPKIICRGTASASLSPASPSMVALRQEEALQRTLEARRQSADIIMTTSTANVGEERKLTGTIVSVSNGIFTTSAVTQQQQPQKIIVYVKTESSLTQHHHQLNSEPTSSSKPSTTSGQFVCPVCLRDFTTEKYLSMHISSIHKTLTTSDGVNLDATAVRRVLTVSSSSVDAVRPLDTISVMSAAHTAGIVWSQSSQQQQQQLVVATQVASTPLILPASATTSKTQWTCHICNKTFAQNSSYKNHVRTHSDDRPYVCSICSIGFKERYHLKKHALFKHTTDLNETCRVCGKKFKDSTAVRAHERIHSDVRPYGCTLCGKTFKTSECLWHHENRSKTCGKMAAAAAAAAGGVDRLVRLKHGADQPVPAGHRRQRRATTVGSPGIVVSRQQQATGYAMVEKVSSTVLVSAVDVELKPEVVQRSNSSQSPSVVVLQREAEDIPELEVKPRIAAAVARRSPPCPVMQNVEEETSSVTIKTEPDCELFDVNLNAMFETEDQSFEDFWQNFDLDTTPDNTDETSSTTETASSSPETTDSETTAADEALLLRDLVSAASTATSSSGVAASGQGGSLTGSKRFDCTRCEKRFASAATLEKHLLVHAEIRPYRCALCDIGFKLKVHLKKHNLYRHSEEYPCECSICGKRFKDSSAVRLHERIHSSDRPFQCTHCGKSFKTRENLWGHRNRGPCDKSLLSASAQSASTVSTTAPAVTTATDAVQCGGTGVDVTQRFVANNIRLFHSAEFGPILGVPVSATKLVLKEVRSGKTAGRTSTAGLESTASVLSLSVGADRKPLGTSNVQLFSVSSSGIATTVSGVLTSSSGYLPQRVSAIRLGQQTQARTTASTLPTLSVPTAVVTPIKRETIQSSTAPITAAYVTHKFASTSLAVQPSSTSTVVVSRPSVVRPSTLFEPDMRKRSKSASVADQCPTVQKFLALGGRSADTVSRFPGINKILETTLTSSGQTDADALLNNNNNNDDDFSSVENNLTDAITVLTESIMSESASGALMMEGDSLVDSMTGADVDWPLGGELGTPLVDGRLNKVDGGHWTDLMAADQLLNSTDEDDLSEDSFCDYQFMPPSPLTLASDGQEAVVGQSGNTDVKFDTNDFITPTSDAMWCDWPPENDLNSLLIFGP